MEKVKKAIGIGLVCFCGMIAATMLLPVTARGGDLPEVRKAGVLRHLGVPYANFVTGSGDGMDVELIRNFARTLGVRYEYVKTDWGTVVGDLTGKEVQVKGDQVIPLRDVSVKGDLVANGFTVLPWRQKVVEFSTPTFPSQIWLIARADSKARPIRPSRSIDRDIRKVRALLKGKKVLALEKTCLAPDLYKLSETGAHVVCFTGKLNELAPAVINGEAEMTILDVPDALIALKKWPGKIKVIGPISQPQEMAVAFPKDSTQLLKAFNEFLAKSFRDGSYAAIVNKYYPSATGFFPEFFKGK
jgi:ABC-type amino acid transport substrate-binding protein